MNHESESFCIYCEVFLFIYFSIVTQTSSTSGIVHDGSIDLLERFRSVGFPFHLTLPYRKHSPSFPFKFVFVQGIAFPVPDDFGFPELDIGGGEAEKTAAFVSVRRRIMHCSLITVLNSKWFWEFEYIGINDNEADMSDSTVVLGTGERKHKIKWNDLRRAINDYLAELGINEAEYRKHLNEKTKSLK